VKAAGCCVLLVAAARWRHCNAAYIIHADMSRELDMDAVL